jgi:hypothetical protein
MKVEISDYRFGFKFEKTKIKNLKNLSKSATETKQKLLIDEVNEIVQNWMNFLFAIVFYLGILLRTVGFRTRLLTLTTF